MSKSNIGSISLYILTLFFSCIGTQVSNARKIRDEQFATLEAQEAALSAYGKKAAVIEEERARDGMSIERVTKVNKKYLKRYFWAFPRDFETFYHIYERYYYDSSYVPERNPWGTFHPFDPQYEVYKDRPETDYDARMKAVNNLSHLFIEIQKVIPKRAFYDKLIQIGCGGIWCEAASPFLTNYLHIFMCQDLSLTVHILEQKKDDEIAGLFFFLYDGPHPGHPAKKASYNELYDRMKKVSPRIAKLLKLAYDKLLSGEHGCCGH